MRLALLTALFVCLPHAMTARGQDPDSKPDEAALARQRADATLELGQAHAAEYAVFRDGNRDAAFKLSLAPVLKFTNPVPQQSGTRPQEIYGGVFLGVNQGCPEAVLCVLKVFAPGPPFILHELTSLSDHRVVAERKGIRQWYPDRAGVARLPVPDAPRPAESAQGRLAQMRAMSRQFAANKTDDKNRTTELRLLSKPLYRYDSSDPDVTDGALFAFVDGTDPEVLLVLEARRDAGPERWCFAAARLNLLELKVVFQSRQVWQVPSLSQDEWRNRAAPYALLRLPDEAN